MCRGALQVISVEKYSELSIREGRAFGDTRSQASSATSVTSRNSFAPQFVIMPAEFGRSTADPALRATLWKATLPNGEKTITPDTGAFESVTGAILARELAKDAVANVAKVCIEQLGKHSPLEESETELRVAISA